jgi:hypothetical protein
VQLLAAACIIVEEKYLVRYRAPVLLAVGLEGFWGLALSCAALPALSLIQGPEGRPLDSFGQAWEVSRRTLDHMCGMRAAAAAAEGADYREGSGQGSGIGQR